MGMDGDSARGGIKLALLCGNNYGFYIFVLDYHIVKYCTSFDGLSYSLFCDCECYGGHGIDSMVNKCQ